MSKDSDTVYNPEGIIKKEARGLGEDADFGSPRNWNRPYSNTQRHYGR